MDPEKTTGYRDQELLLNALIAFLAKHVNRSEHIIRGMIKQSISQWASEHNSSLKEIKIKDEEDRLRFVSEIIDIFLEKIKHIIESKMQREKLKKNALLIYEQWKRTKRDESSE